MSSNPHTILTCCDTASLAWMEIRTILAKMHFRYDFKLLNREVDFHRDSEMHTLWDKPRILVHVVAREEEEEAPLSKGKGDAVQGEVGKKQEVVPESESEKEEEEAAPKEEMSKPCAASEETPPAEEPPTPREEDTKKATPSVDIADGID